MSAVVLFADLFRLTLVDLFEMQHIRIAIYHQNGVSGIQAGVYGYGSNSTKAEKTMFGASKNLYTTEKEDVGCVTLSNYITAHMRVLRKLYNVLMND
jgi:hypothetical protein